MNKYQTTPLPLSLVKRESTHSQIPPLQTDRTAIVREYFSGKIGNRKPRSLYCRYHSPFILSDRGRSKEKVQVPVMEPTPKSRLGTTRQGVGRHGPFVDINHRGSVTVSETPTHLWSL